MHPEVQMTKPGKCPKCGMTLVKKIIKSTKPQSQPSQKDTMQMSNDTLQSKKEDMKMDTNMPMTDKTHENKEAKKLKNKTPKKFKKKGKSIGGVGLAYAFGLFDPVDPNSASDVKAAEVLTTLSNWDWLKGAEPGHLEFRLEVPGQVTQVMVRDMPGSRRRGADTATS